MVDIFNPEVSEVVRGLQGKSVLLYGTNRTGKTANAIKAPKPIVACFEDGLAAVGGVPNVKIKTWSDWQAFVQQLTSPMTFDKAKELYSTVIIDGADSMGMLCADFICSLYGVARINDGNKGYGLWKEFSTEIEKHLRAINTSLNAAGYLVIYITHETEREFLNERGEKYTKIYPAGDKRVIDPICNLCNIIGYAKVVCDANGLPSKSVLYLVGTPAFHAGTNFDYMPQYIEEWSLDKLESALINAIDMKAKESGTKTITSEQAVKKEQAKAKKEEAEKKPISEIIEAIGNKVTAIGEANNGNIERYYEVMGKVLGTREFRAMDAGESQREQLEVLLKGLVDAGL